MRERLFTTNLIETGLCHHRSWAWKSTDSKGGSFWSEVAWNLVERERSMMRVKREGKAWGERECCGESPFCKNEFRFQILEFIVLGKNSKFFDFNIFESYLLKSNSVL